MPDHTVNPTRRSQAAFIAVLILAAAHLPFLYVQCKTLWSLEHYQFFPFAFAVFGWLFYTRRVQGVVFWDAFSSLLLVADVGLLVGGSVMNSPLAVYSGAVLLCFVISRASADAEYDRSLAYLGLLPLITVRPPLAMDTNIINWLQAVTTKVGSLLLNHFGYLHVREGNILEFPGKRFLVQEACSGVQSLFAVLFLASLIVCGYRRRFLHSVLVLFCGAGFAGLMNVLRICTISIAWDVYGMDLSTGWQHDMLGYIALMSAAFLVFSADAFLDLVFYPVPGTVGGGVSLLYRNPLIVFWNRVFGVRKRKSLPESGFSSPPKVWHTIAVVGAAVVFIGVMVFQIPNI